MSTDIVDGLWIVGLLCACVGSVSDGRSTNSSEFGLRQGITNGSKEGANATEGTQQVMYEGVQEWK